MNELEQTMTRYLLGELSESEQSALEEKYFTDPQIFNEVLKIESELVDGYARGQLADDVRERFEQSYMAHPARGHRVKFAAALATRLDQIEEVLPREHLSLPVPWWQRLIATLRGQGPTLRFSIALATLLVVLAGVWIFVETGKRHEELARARAEQQRREREQSEERRRAEESAVKQPAVEPNPQLPQATPNPTEGQAPRSVSLAFTVGGVRGGDTNPIPKLIIPSGTTQARLLLNLKENNYPRYRASLQTIGGIEVFSQKGIKPLLSKTGAIFVFTVPARKFAAGDYVLTLRGINPDGEVDDLSKSLFRVEKK
jgi:anti-sigma factor RsiW